MGSWEITKLRLEAQIANLEAVIDSKDDDIMGLIDEVRELKAVRDRLEDRIAELDRELDNRRNDSWRSHR